VPPQKNVCTQPANWKTKFRRVSPHPLRRPARIRRSPKIGIVTVNCPRSSYTHAQPLTPDQLGFPRGTTKSTIISTRGSSCVPCRKGSIRRLYTVCSMRSWPRRAAQHLGEVVNFRKADAARASSGIGGRSVPSVCHDARGLLHDAKARVVVESNMQIAATQVTVDGVTEWYPS